MAREHWIKLFIRGVSPSDAVRVRLKDDDITVLDLKERFLESVNDILPGRTSVHWITLTCPANEADPVAPVVTLESSQDLVDLPEGAGGKRWHLHADVRLIGWPHIPLSFTARRRMHKRDKHSLQGPSAKGLPRGSNQSKGGANPKPLTLFERGIAGEAEPEHIKNALDMRDLYPGGVLPQGAKEEFSLFAIVKLMSVFAILGMGAAVLLYFLESRPDQWLGGVKDDALGGTNSREL